MKKYTLAVIILALLFCGCEFLTEKKYDITIVNDLFGGFDVYLDGNFQFTVAEAKSQVIQDVPEGKHRLECGHKVLGYELIQSWEEFDLQADIEWSILKHYSLGEWYSL
jgi:hypothetical protein